MYHKVSAKIIKQNMDLLILTMLDKKPTHGYDLIAEFYNQFDILLSPGTLYPVLYNLESMGFLNAEVIGKTKKYFVTDLGRKRLEAENKVFQRTVLEIDQYISR